MQISTIISKISIPYRNLAYVLMLLGLVSLFVSFHLAPSLKWLPYASVGVMALSILYLCFFVYKAGYKNRR